MMEQPSSLAQSYRLNEPAVITDQIDGEWVIMNLANGAYYGLDPVASYVWQSLLSGETPQAAGRDIAAHFEVPEGRVTADIATFLAQLLDEGLLIAGSGLPEPVARGEGRVPASPYAAPCITRYADMTRLLALDPPLPV